MNHKYKKGFTLIELLAVIVILAVIALIAVPIILNMIENAKKGAAKDSAYGYIEAIEYKNSESIFDEDKKIADGTYEVYELKNIALKGTKPIFGDVTISKGIVLHANMCIGGYIVDYDGKQATVYNKCTEETDTTGPNIIISNVSGTSNSITIPFIVQDDESGIKEVNCMYGIDGKYTEKGKIENNECKIKKLKSNIEYNYKIEAKNKAGVTAEKIGTAKTVEFESIGIEVEPKDEWATKREVTITGKAPDAELKYQLNGTDGEWIIIESGTTLTFNENVTIYIILTDGINKSEEILVISTIDTSAPSLVLDDIIKTTKSITIPYIVEDKESGIKETTCEYWTSESDIVQGKIENNECKITSKEIKSGTTYNYKITTKNNAGVEKEVTGNINTVETGTCSISITDDGEWTTSKTATIIGNISTGEELQYRIKSGDTTKVDWTTIDSGKSHVIDWTSTDEVPTSVYCQVTDGNNTKSGETKTIMTIDTTKPTCTFSGESTSWRISGTIKATCKDETGGSGCTSGTATKSWTYTSGTATTKTATLSYTIIDNAGNSTTCSKTANVYVDRTPPTCTWSGESTSWRKSGTIKATCADTNGSGCTTETATKSWAYTSGTDTIATASLSYEMQDAVGNKKTCGKKANIYVDRTAPTCDWSGESTSWRQTGTIKVTCNKGTGSACNSSYATKSWAYTSGTATTKTAALSYGIKDAVGNSTTCSKTAQVYVDRTPPTCTWSGESTSWRTSGTIKATCADTNGSGCTTETATKSWAYTSGTDTTSTATLSYEMQDAVGNKKTCSKTAQVYVDRTPPTCGSWSGTSTTWTSADRTISVGCSDSGSQCSSSTFSQTFSSNYKTATAGITISDRLGNARKCTENVNVYVAKTANVTYTTYVNGGPTITASNGGFSGTVGQSLHIYQISGVTLSLPNLPNMGNIYVQAAGSALGNTNISSSVINSSTGAYTSPASSDKMIESVRFWLDGDAANAYDIWYRAYVRVFGWLDPVKNNTWTGTSGIGVRLEALEVKVVPKNTSPGSWNENGGQCVTSGYYFIDSNTGDVGSNRVCNV